MFRFGNVLEGRIVRHGEREVPAVHVHAAVQLLEPVQVEVASRPQVSEGRDDGVLTGVMGRQRAPDGAHERPVRFSFHLYLPGATKEGPPDD